MKVLLTGSSGFLGKALISALKEKKHSVIEYDLDKEKNILDEKQLLLEMKKADAVIHLAGIVETTHKQLWEINVHGTKNVIECAKKTNKKKVVFMSTTGVYGFTKGEVSERTPINPQNDYEKSKALGEKIVLAAKNKIPVCIVRGAMIFGANNYWEKMFSMLKKKYPLPCSGENHFQIIYVTELARAILLVLEKGKSGEIYLASGKEKPTLNEFCEMIQAELGLEKGLIHIPDLVGIIIGKILKIKLLAPENIRHISKERNYDTKKIEELGYTQKIPLKKAIKETLDQLNEKKKEKETQEK